MKRTVLKVTMGWPTIHVVLDATECAEKPRMFEVLHLADRRCQTVGGVAVQCYLVGRARPILSLHVIAVKQIQDIQLVYITSTAKVIKDAML